VDAILPGLCPDKEGVAWLNSFIADIESAKKNVAFDIYHNYADPALGSGKDAGERY